MNATGPKPRCCISYDGKALGLALLGFNLGNESFHLLLVLLVLPALYFLARHRSFAVLRTAAAVAGAVTAIVWIVQRLSRS